MIDSFIIPPQLCFAKPLAYHYVPRRCPILAAVNVFHLTQASSLLPMVTVMRNHGFPIENHLARARIPLRLLHSAYAPIPKRTHFWQFLDGVSASEGLETIGFLLGDPLDLSLTGPWGRNLLRSASLFEALNRASRSIRHFAQGNSIHLHRHEGKATIRIENIDPVKSRTADHTGLKLLITLAELVADPGWKPKKATLRTECVGLVEAMPSFGDCDLRFSQHDASLEIPEEYLSRPMPTFYEEHGGAGTQLFQLPEDGKIASKLQMVLATFLPYYGPLPVEEAADILGVSRTTMFRQLTVEGESYRNLVEKVRYSAARQLLASPVASVKEISHALGYQNPNNFTRAFQRIAGVPPTEFRRKCAEVERVMPGA